MPRRNTDRQAVLRELWRRDRPILSFVRLRTQLRQTILRKLWRTGVARFDVRGRVDATLEIYLDAIDRWRAVESVLDLALCELDLALVLGKDNEEAKVAKEARDIFVQIGAQVFVQRLSELIDTQD